MDRTNIPRRVGIYQVLGQNAIDEWLYYTQKIGAKKTPYTPSRNHAWYLSTCRLNGTYAYEELMQCGDTEFKFIHTPGHSEGFCCVFFPGEELICTGDIDLTPFGPWYGGTDSDIDAFINSSQKIANLEAKNYATGHEIGTLSGAEFKLRLEKYLDIINKRDTKIVTLLESAPRTLDELTKLGMIYGGPKYMKDPWAYAWEQITLLKHLIRLEKNKKIIKNGAHYEIH